MGERDYKFIESTISICPECLERVDAKIILKDGKIFLLKFCKKHGEQIELLEEDPEYYLKRREYDKPGTVSKTQTKVEKGCPFDCGLCPSHDQHTCIGLIEVTKDCDLNCPVCFADGGDKKEFLDLDKIGEMMDFFQNSEGGKAEILQISGGEPTTHPEIIEILKLAREKKFQYVMLNTNGIKIAEDEEFVKQLSEFRGGFEVYLQFDGFEAKTYEHFRGKNIFDLKKKAISNLAKHKIPITLVSTIEKGINDDEIGRIVEFGLKTDFVRGINFQPIAFFGRHGKVDTKDRMTLTGILKRIEAQTQGAIKKDDLVPLPCNVERVAVTFLYKSGQNFIPITRKVNVKSYLPLIDNTFAFDADKILKEKAQTGCCNCMKFLKEFKPIIPLKLALKSKEERMKYVDENTFRMSVTSFIDVYNFDLKSMQKECVHFITPDLKRIPFSAYNMFHRKRK